MPRKAHDAQPLSEAAAALERMRHSASHVMAAAVLERFPEAKLAIGPAIDDGFYYDFDLPRALTPDDLAAIEAGMRAIVGRDEPFVQAAVPSSDAVARFQAQGQDYKVELINDIGEAEVGTYTNGGFTDLCRGPHVESTGKIGPFKLLNVAGAYWRGDEKRPMLQRIYGTAFASQADLDAHLLRLEEARKRDHRRLGRDLGIFSVSDEVGGGLVIWHPKGGRLRSLMEDFWRQEHFRAGYELVYSPNIGRAQLWETSGHLGFFRENMFAPMDVDGQEYFLKPMNCPFHIEIYRSTLRSYRDLPIRLAELGTVYRYERAGVLHGLLRVRGFTQDDAHIFCRPDQMEDEILRCLDFTMHIVGAFGFHEYEINVATRPPKAVGSDEDWERATNALVRALDLRGLEYAVDDAGGAFYGPKIDFKIKDAIGRSWQCTTIQFDFNLSQRFDLSYIGEDGKSHRPYMVHRALLGSIERFTGMLIEQYAGAFPVWIAPLQAEIIPIADRHLAYAEQVREQLLAAGLRAHVDSRREKLNYKIREAQLQKVPYMLIVGDKEIEAGAVSVRLRTEENLGAKPVGDFITMVRRVADERSLALT